MIKPARRLPRLLLLALPLLLYGVLPGYGQQIGQPTASAAKWEIIVHSREELLKAIASRSATRIGLASAEYGDLTLTNTPPDMRIGAADDAAQPRLSSLSITDSRRLTVENLNVGPPPLPIGRYQSVISVRRTEGLSLVGLDISGAGIPPALELRGVSIEDSTGVAVHDCSFSGLYRGLVAFRVDGLTFRQNTINEMSSDGINFAQVQNITITRNRFGAFKTTPDSHADYIQFWADGTSQPSKNIVINENVMLKGDGDDVQGIFLQFQPRLPAENIAVRNNIIVQASPHGITLYHVNGAQLERNIVLSTADSKFKVAIRVIDSSRVTVSNNAAMAVAAENAPQSTLSGNVQYSFEDKNRLKMMEQRLTDALEGRGDAPPDLKRFITEGHRSAGKRPAGNRD